MILIFVGRRMNGNTRRRKVVLSEEKSNSSSFREFSVLTYNVLSTAYEASDYHDYTPLEQRHWSYRWKIIQGEIEAFSPDIICFQEVNETMLLDLVRFLVRTKEPDGQDTHSASLGYLYDSIVDGVVGLAVFYRASLFKSLSSRKLNLGKSFSDMMEHKPQLLLASETNAKDRKFCKQMAQRKQRVMIMSFQILGNQDLRFILANTHLYHDPRYPDAKLLQAYQIVHEIATFAIESFEVSSVSSLPVVICGDLNSVAKYTKSDPWNKIHDTTRTFHSGVYELLRKGFVTSEHSHHPAHSARKHLRATKPVLESPLGGLVSGYSEVFGEEPEATTKTNDFDGCLDYCFAGCSSFLGNSASGEGSNQNSMRIAFVAGLEVPLLNKVGPIPNEYFPSDHVPLLFTLRVSRAGQQRLSPSDQQGSTKPE